MSVHRGGRGPGHMVRSSGSAGDGAAVVANRLLLENASLFLLEDGTSKILLEA